MNLGPNELSPKQVAEDIVNRWRNYTVPHYEELISAIAAVLEVYRSATLPALIQRIFDQHKAAGWYSDPATGKPLELTDGLWAQKINLIHSEISEAVEGRRKDLQDDKLPHRKMEEVEIADAFIRICDLSAQFGYDLPGAIEEKLEYNAHRADHKLAARLAPGGKRF